MDLEVDRNHLRRVRNVERRPVPLGPGEARLRIDSFGLTANNVTYAVFGDAMGYWQFFPVPDEPAGGGDVHWGQVPVWGFADVVESAVPGVAETTRVYGYFPMAEELVVSPGRVDQRGFSDVSAHRQALPSVYNRYSFTATDPVYRGDREPQQMLLWPLFVTSFVVDDFLGDHGMFGSGDAVISSASAKTSIATAFLLARRHGVEVVGLTSTANLDFVRGLGCYHRACTYEDVASLPVRPSCYVDVAGRRDVTGAVHAHFGESLGYSMVVGDTNWEDASQPDGPLPGPRPTFLFAPDQIAKRRRQWGGDGFERNVAGAWSRFAPWTDGWMKLRHARGPAEVEQAYRRLVNGRVDPRLGDVCTLQEHRSIPAGVETTEGRPDGGRD
jgi:hypothetical protein